MSGYRFLNSEHLQSEYAGGNTDVPGIQYRLYDRHFDSGANGGIQARCSARAHYACSGAAFLLSVGKQSKYDTVRHGTGCGGKATAHRAGWQIGNLKGREQRELADDHPLKQIYEKRLNTINCYVKRGTLDADLAEVMKKLAKDKMLRALSNVAHAKGDYEKEMGQDNLKKEVLGGNPL